MPANAYAIVGQQGAVHHDPGPRVESAAEIGAYASSDERLDHFIQRDGEIFAGTHLILDFHGATGLDDLERMERGLRGAVEAAGATLLHIHLHHFTPNGGISGVAVLAESHISVHTWPERDYAAFNDTYARYFPDDRRPARTTVGVTALAVGALVEIDCVARRP